MLYNSPPKATKNQQRPLKAEVYQYNAISDGEQRIYTNQDELTEYGTRGILSPDEVSYYNLFINGVLQPGTNYELSKGVLILKTADVPQKGVVIILSFVTFFIEKDTVLNLASVEGGIPSGVTKSGPVSDLPITVCSLPQNPCSCLDLEISVNSGPPSLSAGQLGNWVLVLTITNKGTVPIINITITDTILLDKLVSIEPNVVSRGKINIAANEIVWHVDSLEIGEAVHTAFNVKGCFSATGTRYLSRGWGMGDTSYEIIKSLVSAGHPIMVSGGLSILKTITSGPLALQPNCPGKWRVEIKITNASALKAVNLVMKDELLVDSLNQIDRISLSKGMMSSYSKEIIWDIDVLEAMETAVLVLEISGAFSEEGCKSLDRAVVSGENSLGQLMAGPTEDNSISVSFPTAAADCLKIEKEIFAYPMVSFKEKYAEWRFILRIWNLSNRLIKDIIVTDDILLDELTGIEIEASVSGEIEASDASIFWRIQELAPGSSLTAAIKVGGYFKATGLRSLNRAMATGYDSRNPCFIMTGIESGAGIRVLDIQQDLKHACILTDKVFWQCQDRCCLEDISLDLTAMVYRDISFESGTIPEGSLQISRLAHRPHFKRVRLKIRIPYTVNLPNGKAIEAYLPDIDKDIIMYMPETTNGFSYQIIVETKTELLKSPIVINQQLSMSLGVFIIIKAMRRVQLMIPCLDGCPEANECKDYSKASTAYSYSLNQCYDHLYPLQERSILRQKQCRCMPPPKIFGELRVDKYIVSGPLRVNNHNSIWRFEIKVTNIGHGPVSFIRATDELLLNSIHSVNVISSSQGTASIVDGVVIWGVGTLYSYTSALLLIEVNGAFDISKTGITVENLQYNAVSDGIRREFTNADELVSYGVSGIPGPDEVSFYSLFINGALQPPVNYEVREGELLLTTVDVPLKGAPVILQSFIIKNWLQQLLKANTYQYNAYAGDKKSYTDSDELTMYGDKGILPPESASLYNLYINSVLQPPVNYWVVKGLLMLTTSNLPHPDAPVSLQYISVHV